MSFDHQGQAEMGPGPVPGNGEIGSRASWDTSVGGGVSVRGRKGRGSLWTINIWETDAGIQEACAGGGMRPPRGPVCQHSLSECLRTGTQFGAT